MKEPENFKMHRYLVEDNFFHKAISYYEWHLQETIPMRVTEMYMDLYPTEYTLTII